MADEFVEGLKEKMREKLGPGETEVIRKEDLEKKEPPSKAEMVSVYPSNQEIDKGLIKEKLIDKVVGFEERITLKGEDSSGEPFGVEVKILGTKPREREVRITEETEMDWLVKIH